MTKIINMKEERERRGLPPTRAAALEEVRASMPPIFSDKAWTHFLSQDKDVYFPEEDEIVP